MEASTMKMKKTPPLSKARQPIWIDGVEHVFVQGEFMPITRAAYERRLEAERAQAEDQRARAEWRKNPWRHLRYWEHKG
jgi:hypothetical protein